MEKTKNFLLLQFSALLLFCTMIPNLDLFKAVFYLPEFSLEPFFMVVGIIGAGFGLYGLLKDGLKDGVIPYLCCLGVGILAAIISLFSDINWMSIVGFVALIPALILAKKACGIEWKTPAAAGATILMCAALLHVYSPIGDRILVTVASLIGLILFFVGIGKFASGLDAAGKSAAGKLKTAAIIGIIAVVIGWIPLMGIVKGILCIIAFIIEIVGYSGLKKSATIGASGKTGASLLLVSAILLAVGSLLGIIPFVGDAAESVFAAIAVFFLFFGWSSIAAGAENQAQVPPVIAEEKPAPAAEA